jgi:hypothetical protein
MKRHRTDALSLAFGAVYLLVAGWWLIGQRIDLGLPQLGWALALGLIVLGVVGLLGAMRSHREPVRSSPEPPPLWPGEDDH